MSSKDVVGPRDPDPGVAVLAAAVCGPQGEVLLRVQKPVEEGFVGGREVLEAMALMEGLHAALELGIRSVEVVTDYRPLHNHLRTMAFANKLGSLVKKTPSSVPSLFQAIRCMSSSKLFVGAKIIIDRETRRSRGLVVQLAVMSSLPVPLVTTSVARSTTSWIISSKTMSRTTICQQEGLEDPHQPSSYAS